MAAATASRKTDQAESPAAWPPLPAALRRAEPAPGAPIRLLAAAGAMPGARLPLAMADVVAVLWTRALKFDAADPNWPDRDRFVLSDDHDALLQDALLRLTGEAPAPAATPREHGHPGSHGQGVAIAIGLALAERMLAARFGRSLADHRTWVVTAEPDLASGLGHEAISLAGELRLGRLAVLHDAGQAPIADLAKRFHAAGWAVRTTDGHDPAAIAAALAFAVRSRRPSLICCHTSPAAAAPSALAAEDTGDRWRAASQRGATARRAWLKRLAQHPQRPDFERALHGRRPDEWRDILAALPPRGAGSPGASTASENRRVLDALLAAVPEMLTSATSPAPAAARATGHDAYRSRRLGFGAREHGMAAAMNGLALHGGWLPVGRTAAGDALRPALRQAALLRRQVIHLLTADDAPGTQGPPHTENLASLRAIQGVLVFRPADAAETFAAWELALRRADAPSVIVLSDQPAPPLPRAIAAPGHGSPTSRGGYLVIEPAERRAVTLIATGPEVAVALQAQAALAAEGFAVAVVSLPCWELFARQDAAYRSRVLGTAPRIGIETACGFGWERWLGSDGRFIGSAAADAHFSIPPDAVIEAVRAVAARI
jgi:transketolase